MKLIVSLSLCVCVLGLAHAQDWPSFRVRGQQHWLAIASSTETQPKASVADLLVGGKYPVGFKLFVREDSTRTFTLKSGVPRSRPIRMFVWHPARVARSKQPMTFRSYVEAEGRGVTDAAARLSETMGGAALSETQLQTVLDSPARAFADAAAAPGRFPLLLLGGGLNGTAYHHTLLAEYLSSHGYLVAALSPLPEREGGRLPFDKTGLGELVGDMQFALRELAAEPQVDIQRLGLAGWSVGGVALAAVAARDARVDAFVSLDSGLSYDYGLPLLDQYIPARRPRPTPLLDLRGPAPSRFVVARDSRYFDSAPGQVAQVNVASLNHAQCYRWPCWFRLSPEWEIKRIAVMVIALSPHTQKPFLIVTFAATGVPPRFFRVIQPVMAFLPRWSPLIPGSVHK
jgi:dienelactone hydrolase